MTEYGNGPSLRRHALYQQGDTVELHAEPTHEGPHPSDADNVPSRAVIVALHQHPGNPLRRRVPADREGRYAKPDPPTRS